MTWLTNWNSRKTITISNSGSALTDHQVLVTIDTATLISSGKLLSSCNDIRFTSSDGSTLLNYWIESGINSSSTKIWVNIPSIANGNNTIYLYYNNSLATSISNGTNTFVFFDDFDSLTGWTQQSGIWSTSSSIVTYPNGAGYLKYNNPLTLSDGYIVDAKIMSTLTGKTVNGFYLFKSTNTLNDSIGYRAGVRTDVGAISPTLKLDNVLSYGNYDNIENVWNILELIVPSYVIKYSSDDIVTVPASTLTKYKELTTTEAHTGSWRITYDVTPGTYEICEEPPCTYGPLAITSRLYKNGVVYGTNHVNIGSASLSEDFTSINIANGDKIQIYAATQPDINLFSYGTLSNYRIKTLGYPSIKQLDTSRVLLGSISPSTRTTSTNDYFGLVQTETDQVKMDWILVRKYSSPEPIFSATGTEETLATPANITATSMTITPSSTPCISGSCTVTVDVIWTNTGETSGSFTPSIKIDTIPVVVSPPLSPVSVDPSLTASQQFIISGLTTGTHNICPDPN